jgi:uncharacterized OsmC-like protein
MADLRAHRSVSVGRGPDGQLVATNVRGGTLSFGGDTDFTPTELLLVAIASCTAIDVDTLTSRRAQPSAFEVVAEADKVRDDLGNHLTDITVTFRLEFPTGEAGDAARAVLPDAVKKSHDRICTVGRTVELGSPITARVV